MSEPATVICIMGPTASGKTGLAIELAKRLPIDIISVDSALIYKGMDIGSAKPTAEELEQAPHQLIDILDPAQSYSAADFRRDAIDAIKQSLSNGKVPVLVGGTMLYFKALIEGISPLPAADETVRANLLAQVQSEGWPAMHDRLKSIDPVSAERIHPNDPQRLLRALEVYDISGKSLTELTAVKSEALPFNFVQFAIAPKDRKDLHKLIEQRFHLMIDAGFVSEVARLKERKDLHLDLPSMRCVGYRQCWQYLDGELSFDEMIERGIIATRQLAKRQLTWLRNWQNLTWLESGDASNIEKVLQILE